MPQNHSRDEIPRLGAKVRSLRRRENLSQAQFAEKLGVSSSYVNLIENNRRPLPAPLLIRMAQQFGVDLASFGDDDDTRLVADLLEAFSDPLFENHDMTSVDVREMSTSAPATARAVLHLYRAYQENRDSLDSLATRVREGEGSPTLEPRAVPSEEVSDLIQHHSNYFPELESMAQKLWRDAKLAHEELHQGLVRWLERTHGVEVRVGRWSQERNVLRRFDPNTKVLHLSELLPTRSRRFQIAHQVGLLLARDVIDRILDESTELTTEGSVALGRAALANYFAGAVMMPYESFLTSAKEERYDVDVLGRRFRVGFEQVSHRLTTLRKPGAEGVPFHMVRVDVAGNISKRFSASGIRIPRFSGVCPRWNIFAAFQTPGMIRIQHSRMPDGTEFFCIARTVAKDSIGYRPQQTLQAIGLGCPVQHARELVYSEGYDLGNVEGTIPVGSTCRTCTRDDCEDRAMPSLRSPLRIDENVRGVSIYARA